MPRAVLLFSGLTLLAAAIGCSEYDIKNGGDQDVGVGDRQDPDIMVTPGTLVFDDINVTEPNAQWTEIVQVYNEGTGDLQITNIEVDAASPYTLGVLGSNVVASGEYTEFSVTFAPETAGATEAVVYIDSNDPDEPVSEVLLSGLGIAPVIEVSPTTHDFGTQYIGCEFGEYVNISNIGNATLVVQSLDYSTGSVDMEFDPLVESHGPLPWSIAPGAPAIDVWVSYYPLDEVSDIGYLKVNSTDPLTPTELATQQGNGAIYGMQTDVYEQPLNGPVDILFAVDKSCSMDDDIQNVKENFQTFAGTLASLDSDYHISVVIEDNGCIAGPTIYIDNEMSASQQSTAFANMFDQGIAGSLTEAPFQLMSNALSQSGDTGCNAGFLRETATLALVSVSDEREQSPNGWEYYVNLFQSLKGDDDDVIMHSIAGDYPTGCDTNEAGVGHYEAALETGGEFLSICASDFGAHLNAIAVGSVAENQNFELTLEPVPETIEVELNGNPSSEGWEYSGFEDGNYVHFDNNHIPEPGSEIKITYVVKPECEG